MSLKTFNAIQMWEPWTERDPAANQAMRAAMERYNAEEGPQ